ncbi:MAG: putative fluoride ion transporter CrcB [Bacteroidota bacterium]|jgi:CrcB protein
MIRPILLVAIGGALGSVLRYLTSDYFKKFTYNTFPIGTFTANILGCLLIGILIGSLDKSGNDNAPLKWLLVTGFCGGYTTFSTFSYENLRLFQQGNYGLALFYLGSSILLGLLAVALGLFLVK